MIRSGARTPLADRSPSSLRQVAADDRRQIGVDHGARGALVLLDLGQHLGADRDRQIRRQPKRCLLDHLLVDRIGEAVEKAHRQRLHALVQQAAHRALRIGRIERPHDLAASTDALVDRHPQVARDQRRRLGPGDVVHPGHAQVADLQDVAKALGGDQAGARTLVLQDRVRGDRGAVPDLLDVVALDAELLEQPCQSFGDRAGVVVDAGRDFPGPRAAILGQEHDVGEGAADVDADAKAHASPHDDLSQLRVTAGVAVHARARRCSARSRAVACASTRPSSSSTTP